MEDKLLICSIVYCVMALVTYRYLLFVDSKMDEFEKISSDEIAFFTFAWPITVLCFFHAMISESDITDGY